MTPFDTANLTTIFTTLLDWWLKKYSYSSAVAKAAKSLVAATLEVYAGVQEKLLPTPAKIHYTFNLRDVSKVFQGVTKVSTQAVLAAQDPCAYRDLLAYAVGASMMCCWPTAQAAS